MLIWYEYYNFWVSNASAATYAAPMFYSDYSADSYNGINGEALVGTTSALTVWHKYFGGVVSIQDVLDTTSSTGVVKYTWWDINDMYTYAQ
jgi:hypothetical protein